MPFEIKNGVLKKYTAEPGVTAVTIPEHVTKIAKNAFLKNETLTAVTIQPGVAEIVNYAFKKCTALQELTIPDTVSLIGQRAFDDCSSLRVIRLHPDDPAVFRDYSWVKFLGKELQEIFGMFKSRRYSSVTEHNYITDDTVRYALFLLHYLHTHDELLAAYIKKRLSNMMRECIPAGDAFFVAELMKSDMFFTQRNIDTYIKKAQEHEQKEILMLLMNYKNAHLGFGTSKKLRL